ncbi:MAG: DUF1273 family protein [Ruminococcaceae bacterium]|nr:DUF1273 family protein [Oscillospiraceae bacterium]
MNKICCFSGHGKISYTDDVYEKLINLIEDLITNENVSEFWVGNYGNFDRLCAHAVRSLKQKHLSLTLNLIIPYVTNSINEYKQQYQKNYDNILIADISERTPRKLQILKCNEYMVDNSDFMICYVEYFFGGAGKVLEYAKRKKNIKIFNLSGK